jgi:hypothetical protein
MSSRPSVFFAVSPIRPLAVSADAHDRDDEGANRWRGWPSENASVKRMSRPPSLRYGAP